MRKMLNLTLSVSNMFNPRQQNKLPPVADQLLGQPAHKLSKLIKDGSLTSAKLCELYTERIKQVQPIINAVTQDRFKDCLEEARRIDELLASFRAGKPEAEFSQDELEMLRSPLLGVPVSVKESLAVKGMKNSCGVWDRRNVVADESSVVVRNVIRLGMVPICTTNIPECTFYWADCRNKVYGRSLNPYDLSRITGASSGGEGALLASAGSVIGIGSDIGGSLRLPAHFCGINSHKPSPFLISPEGNFPPVKESRLRMFTMGPMTRYASDLRPLLKCLMSDKDNEKQDTYYKFQPDNIATIRKEVLGKLDQPADISQLKFYYFDFNAKRDNKLPSSAVNPEFMEAQQELIDHFRSKFNCQIETIELDKYLKKTLIIWQCMINGGGAIDREQAYDEDEMKHLFGINSSLLELIKMPFGLSNHTLESLLAFSIGSAIPKDRKRAFPLCDKFEKLCAEMKSEVESILGDNGVIVMPTMPNVAYKHNVSLVKIDDAKFTSLFNILQLPVSHATFRLDRKHGLPFGFSVAAKPYNDAVTLSVAEEIEQAFGGWIEPWSVPIDSKAKDKKKAGLKQDNNPTIQSKTLSGTSSEGPQVVPQNA